MELLVENIVEERQLSTYETERNKPMPSTLHAAIQANLSFEFKLNYKERFRVYSEISLDTSPNGSTPDIAVYPFIVLDYTKEYPAKRTDAPLIAIEIQSPSQSFDEMVDKVDVYFAFGVQSCWVIQPRVKGIYVFERPYQYEFYHRDEILKVESLDIKIPLDKIFE